MFIETLEFTIPVELCNVFSNLQKGQKSNVEFPASVNSYGTTQDANIQVVLRSNKLTFKVDGVSSNASMISKSECKTLKLSVFDVDQQTLLPEEEEQFDYNNSNVPMSAPVKRAHEHPVNVPPAKSSRTSYNNDSPRPRSPHHRRSPPRHSQNYSSPRPQSKSQNDTPVNVKQEPEDPDLIEIDDDIEPKKEPFMQIDYSSDVPHTQTSQAALQRLSHPHSSNSQSSSSYHRNVPHVPDYSEPGSSQDHQGDQSADDFLVFQEQEDNEDCDNDVDYGNDGEINDEDGKLAFEQRMLKDIAVKYPGLEEQGSQCLIYMCDQCDKVFTSSYSRTVHIRAVHDNVRHTCVCGKEYKYRRGLRRHFKQCDVHKAQLGTRKVKAEFKSAHPEVMSPDPDYNPDDIDAV